MLLKYVVVGIVGALVGAAVGYFGQCRSGACPLTSSPWGGGIYGAIVAVLLVSMTAGGVSCQLTEGESSNGNPGSKSEVTQGSNFQDASDEVVVELQSESQLDRLFDEHPVVLVDFYADWCGPCRHLKPRIHAIAEEYSDSLKVVAVDVDAHKSLAERFRISGIPDVRLFQEGEQVKAWIGVQARDKYTNAIDAHI